MRQFIPPLLLMVSAHAVGELALSYRDNIASLVRESTRGAAFPDDGYYDAGSRTFYFNKNGA